MSAPHSFPPRRPPRAGLGLLMAGLLALAGEASAAAYTVWLKSAANQPYQIGDVKCAAGAFDFTKSGVASTPVAVTLNVMSNCINNNASAVTLTGNPSVEVREITLNGDAKGPNVDGLAGTLESAVINPTAPSGQRVFWRLTFLSSPGANGAIGSRTFNLQQVRSQGGQTTDIVTGAPYHLYNATALAQNPEPETLWLTLGGLGALVLARRARRRA